MSQDSPGTVNESPPVRPSVPFSSIATQLLFCSLCSGIAVFATAQYYTLRINILEEKARSSEVMSRHCDIARFLMYASTNERLKMIPTAAFQRWLAIAKVSAEPDGGKCYAFTNSMLADESAGIHAGEVAGTARIVVSQAGTILAIDYDSAEF